VKLLHKTIHPQRQKKPLKKESPKFEWEDEVEEEDAAVKYVPPPTSKTSKKDSVDSPEVRSTNTTKSAGRLGAKKASDNQKSFFADFDLESDEEKEEELPPPPTRAKLQADETATRFSRLSYYEDAPKKGSPTPDRTAERYNDNRSNTQGSGRNKPPARDEGTDYARRTFSSAKSISSDQYFGTDKQDSNSHEREARMSKFQGATSISSAAYFDRDESVTVADMTAGDVARKFAYSASTDLNQFSNVVGEGAKKVAAIANSFLTDLQDRYS